MRTGAQRGPNGRGFQGEARPLRAAAPVFESALSGAACVVKAGRQTGHGRAKSACSKPIGQLVGRLTCPACRAVGSSWLGLSAEVLSFGGSADKLRGARVQPLLSAGRKSRGAVVPAPAAMSWPAPPFLAMLQQLGREAWALISRRRGPAQRRSSTSRERGLAFRDTRRRWRY